MTAWRLAREPPPEADASGSLQNRWSTPQPTEGTRGSVTTPVYGSIRWALPRHLPPSRERTKSAPKGALRHVVPVRTPGGRGRFDLEVVHAPGHPSTCATLFGLVHDDRFCGQEQGGDGGGVLQRRPSHF